MLLPTRKTILLFLLPVLPLIVFHGAGMVVFAIAYDVVLLVLALADLFISIRPNDFTVTRVERRQLSLGANNGIGWDLHNNSRHELVFEITEDLPEDLETAEKVIRGRLRGNSRARLEYDVRPTHRGLYVIGDIHVRYQTLLGLLIRQVKFPQTSELKVYPNVANVGRYEVAMQRHRLAEIGLVSSRHKGQGTMFESLRDYVAGDDPVDIAWKATARRGRLITRNCETDRSQNILLVLDCGRLMTTQVDNLSRLDHAINACLLLTHVASKQGDHVGLLAFSDQIETYVPPVRGKGAVARMNEALYRLEPRLRESNYELACQFLALRHRKRSLIIILTDVIDKEASSMLLTYSAHFARRHLPVCVTMRNLETEQLCEALPETVGDCYTKTVALQMASRRTMALERMRAFGVDVLDVNPRHLTPRLLDRYLSLKRSLRL